MLEFSISASNLQPERWRLQMLDPACGGYVSFEGWVRNRNEGRTVLRLEYEFY